MKNKIHLAAIREKLNNEGLVFFENEFTIKTFKAFGEEFGLIYKHRDSADNGVTVVTSREALENAKDGFLGLTNGMLFPHTDRSTLDYPPTILILYCAQQSGKEGETTLVDFKNVAKCLKGSCVTIVEKSILEDGLRSCYLSALPPGRGCLPAWPHG